MKNHKGKNKVAFITGITGQDGSYLAEFLLNMGYEVHGMIRRASAFNTQRIDHIFQDSHAKKRRLFLHYGNLVDGSRIPGLVREIQPDEIYHLAAMSQVRVSFDMPEYTGNVTGLGVTRMLEAIRKNCPTAKFYNAASSEMWGNSPPPQNEKTPFTPLSPYACAKVYAYWMTVSYRQGYSLFACSGILGNHESPRRGKTFVTRKITRGIAEIIATREKVLYLGNLESKRDWGFAPEYVEMMWKMLQLDKPEDFVLGTGVSYSVMRFVMKAFAYAGLDWKKYILQDKKYLRPVEVNNLLVDASKAKKLLGWKPKIDFYELRQIMVDADMRKAGLVPIGEGDEIIKQVFPNKWWKGD